MVVLGSRAPDSLLMATCGAGEGMASVFETLGDVRLRA